MRDSRLGLAFGDRLLLVPEHALRRLDRGHAVSIARAGIAAGGARAQRLRDLARRSAQQGEIDDAGVIEIVADMLVAGDLVCIHVGQTSASVAPPPPPPATRLADLADPVPPRPRAQPAPEPETVLLRIELGALGFAPGSVLMLPRSEGRLHPWAALIAAGRYLQANPGARLVVAGHAEPGEPVDHSRHRADALAHFVANRRSGWLAIAAKWGRVGDTQRFLQHLAREGWNIPALECTDQADEATTAAVLAFQRAHNCECDAGATIYEDGVIGEQTLGAIYDVARADWLRWLEANDIAPDVLASIDACLACAERFKPYRTMPPLPSSHGGRFVDLVIVPADEQLDPGGSPAAVYDVDEILTLSLDGIVRPRSAFLRIEALDPDHRPVADLEVSVTIDGVTMPTRRTDETGVVMFSTAKGGGIVSVALGERIAYPISGGITLERDDPEDDGDDAPMSVPDVAEAVARLFAVELAQLLVFPSAVAPPTPVAPPEPTTSEFGPDNPYRIDELSDFWRHGKTREAIALTDDELALKRATYLAHVKSSHRERRFVASLPRTDLARIGGTRHRLRREAATAFEEMWAAMQAQLEIDRAAGVASAVATVDVGIVDGYRDANEQFTMWDGRFYGYLWSFKKNVLKDETAATADVVAKDLAHYIGGKTACPGYSNHNDGRAIDVDTDILDAKGKKIRLGAQNKARWIARQPWLFGWLTEHCGEHGFAAYEEEPWHWNFP